MLGGVAARSRHSDSNSKLTACLVKYTHEAESVNWKWGEVLNLQACP